MDKETEKVPDVINKGGVGQKRVGIGGVVFCRLCFFVVFLAIFGA